MPRIILIPALVASLAAPLAAQVALPGVYIAMSGQVFAAGEVRKNRAENRFEAL